MRSRFTLAAILSFVACSADNEKTAPAVSPLSVEASCTNVTFGEVGPSWVNWEAIKNKNVPVAGRILGEGEFEMPTDRLVGSKLHMKFDPNSIDSEILLRDDRIKSIFFQMGIFPLATYEGRVEFIEAGEDKVPLLDGESSLIRINGPLSIAGQVVMLEVHASLERENGDLIVRPSERASVIDVKSSGGLAANITSMLEAAGVKSMERLVTLTDGELILEKTCE